MENNQDPESLLCHDNFISGRCEHYTLLAKTVFQLLSQEEHPMGLRRGGLLLFFPLWHFSGTQSEVTLEEALCSGMESLINANSDCANCAGKLAFYASFCFTGNVRSRAEEFTKLGQKFEKKVLFGRSLEHDLSMISLYWNPEHTGFVVRELPACMLDVQQTGSVDFGRSEQIREGAAGLVQDLNILPIHR